ncbi:uncharacterized protein [Watersipora subatra]|uniref:uncharacterized protein n=1 Tax=Watersipora subatra TaxID=2589382 RepID=UPI00355BC036
MSTDCKQVGYTRLALTAAILQPTEKHLTMPKILAIGVLVFTILQLTNSQAVQWLGPFNWAAVSALSANVEFKCALEKNGTALLPENHTIVEGSEQWQLEGKLYGANQTVGNKVIKGDTLLIKGVTLDDKGIYLCHVDLDCNHKECEKERWFKHALNLNGPLYANLMDKYKTNFMVGGIAGGAVLGILVLLCLVYQFRYIDENENAVPREYKQKFVGSKFEETSQEAAEMPGVRVTQYVGADEANTQL